jgi:hypothetical protein
MQVSKELARFFMDQCAGSYSGHMSNIPNNPTLFGLFRAHGVSEPSGRADPKGFAVFLRAVADALDADADRAF